jgi:transposase
VKSWCIAKPSGRFVAKMEDILRVYARPYDALQPVVCLDEKSKELHGEVREALPLAPGKPAREDYEYERNGVSNLFLQVEPLTGKRRVRVTERRTAVDCAHQLRLLVEEDYPEAEKIVLVTDNLNTHHIGCLYEAFEAEEAERIAAKLEWHYTPEHGSWLNMAEIELSVLQRQCLNRRIADRETLAKEIKAWQEQRNKEQITIHWQFTTKDARVKLRQLYPIVKVRK